jgi:hypothetical protein
LTKENIFAVDKKYKNKNDLKLLIIRFLNQGFEDELPHRECLLTLYLPQNKTIWPKVCEQGISSKERSVWIFNWSCLLAWPKNDSQHVSTCIFILDNYPRYTKCPDTNIESQLSRLADSSTCPTSKANFLGTHHLFVITRYQISKLFSYYIYFLN